MISSVFRVGPAEYFVGMTSRAVGNMSAVSETSSHLLQRRRSALTDRPWIWTRLQHESELVLANDEPSIIKVGQPADGIVTQRKDLTIAVHVADCLGIALLSDEGTHAVVHAGWRGVLAGVIEAAVDAVVKASGAAPYAIIGPGIGLGRYEFRGPERDTFAQRYGANAVGKTDWGSPGVDVRYAARSALSAKGVSIIGDWDICTAANGGEYFSYRARRDSERMAFFVTRRA